MGLAVTINTDNMTFAGVGLEDEYDHCLNEMGFTREDLIRMNMNSVRASFCRRRIRTTCCGGWRPACNGRPGK